MRKLREMLEWLNANVLISWKKRMMIPLVYLLFGLTQWSDLSECISKIILVNFAVFMAGVLKPALFANFDSVIVMFFFLWIAKHDNDTSRKSCGLSTGKIFLTASLWIFNCIVSLFTFYITLLGVFIACYIGKRIIRRPVPSESDANRALKNGLTEEELAKLKKTVFRKQCRRNASNQVQESCSICLSSFRPSTKVIILEGCQHTFHEGCVKKWLCSQPYCPYCRKNVKKTGSKPQNDHSIIA